MKRFHPAFIIALLLATLPGEALAQTNPPTVTPEAIIAATAEDGLPVEALRKKLREGVSKGMPAVRIAPVLQRLREQQRMLRDARAISMKDGAVLDAALAAMKAGASVESIAAIASRAGGDTAGALYGLGVACSAGASDSEARSYVLAQVDAKMSGTEMASVADVSARALRAGLVTGRDLSAAKSVDFSPANRSRYVDQLRGFGGRTGMESAVAPLPEQAGDDARREKGAEAGVLDAKQKTGQASGGARSENVTRDRENNQDRDERDHEDDSQEDKKESDDHSEK